MSSLGVCGGAILGECVNGILGCALALSLGECVDAILGVRALMASLDVRWRYPWGVR